MKPKTDLELLLENDIEERNMIIDKPIFDNFLDNVWLNQDIDAKDRHDEIINIWFNYFRASHGQETSPYEVYDSKFIIVDAEGATVAITPPLYTRPIFTGMGNIAERYISSTDIAKVGIFNNDSNKLISDTIKDTPNEWIIFIKKYKGSELSKTVQNNRDPNQGLEIG